MQPLALILIAILPIFALATASPSRTTSNEQAQILPRPLRILVRSGWHVANIGDIAHTTGFLGLLKTHAPGTEAILWPVNIGGEVEPMIRHYFPDTKIVRGGIGPDGMPNTDELREAFSTADIFVYNSAPDISRSDNFNAWHRFTNGKPYVIFGATIDRESALARHAKTSSDLTPDERRFLDHASAIYTRETASLDYIRRQGVNAPVIGMTPDAVFAVRQYDTPRAEAWLRARGLSPGRYICAIPRLRLTPFYLVNNRLPSPSDRERIRYNVESAETDLGKMRDVITRWIRETGLPVVLVPEITYEIGLAREEIIDRLPPDAKPYVVWRDTFWLPDEAAAVYRDAIALLSMDCHSPIIAAAAGTPALYLRTPMETGKVHMWNDLGLGDRMFDIETASANAIAEALLALHRNPESARSRIQATMTTVNRMQIEALRTVLDAAARPSAPGNPTR